MTSIEDITPVGKPRVIDLLSSLGINVDAWSDIAGGKSRASNNPKYCYEWSYEGDNELIVVNFWTRQFSQKDDRIIWKRDIKDFTETGHPSQRARGRKLKAALLRAFQNKLKLHVIICVGDRKRDGSKSQVKARGLDAETWAVTDYEVGTGIFTVERGIDASPRGESKVFDVEAEFSGFEGEEKIRWFVKHRKREGRLRSQKIAHVLKHKGKLVCEVLKCGFEFEATYGEIGRKFAHVHHKTSLSSLSEKGEKISLSDLAIVCANCHAMIHRGGQCRALTDLKLKG